VERNLEAYAIAIDRMQRALARPAD
jgi:hypothetical protein